MSYTKISELISLWGEYEKLVSSASFEDFGKWLAVKHGKDKELASAQRKTESYKAQWDTQEEGLKHHHKLKSEHVQIGILIGRLAKYARMYSKKALQNLNLNLDEFTFLAAIFHMKTPIKAEVIHVNLFEPTSGTEILRRLIKIGYVKESVNKEDKRSKLLKLTDKGQTTLMKAFEQMCDVGVLVAANMTGAQRKELISILDYLNDFHVHLYLNYKDKEVEELIKVHVKK